MTIEERLEKLEQELARAQRKNRWQLLAFLCAGILVVGGLTFAEKSNAQVMLGIGGGYTILPTNKDELALLTPDVEKVGSPYLLITGLPKMGYNLGFSISGYNVEKWVSILSERITMKWKVPHYNVYASYRTQLGIDSNGPSLALHVGGTYTPVEITGEYKSGYSTVLNETDTENKFGPYIGADMLIPLKGTNFSAFLLAEKSFITYDWSGDDVNLGALVLSAGIAYSFGNK